MSAHTKSPQMSPSLAQQQAVLIAIAEKRNSTSIVEKTLDGRIVGWNRTAAAMYGYDASEMVGKSGLVLHDPREVESGRASAIFERALLAGKWEGRVYRIRKDGSGLWVKLTLLLRRDSQGRPSSLVGISRDLTEFERIEHDVQRSRALGSSLVESKTQPLVATDSAGVVTDANSLFCELLRAPREALVGVRLCDLFRDSGALTRAIANAPRDEESSVEGLRFSEPSAEKVELRATVCSIQPSGSVLVVMEGPEGWAESRAATSSPQNPAPRRPSTTPPASRSRASNSEPSPSSPSAELSHELRTPLTAVIGFAELMRSGQAGPMGLVQREYMDDILDSAHHMLRVLNAELESAQKVRSVVPARPVELGDVLVSARSALRLAAAKKDIAVEIDCGCELTLAAENATRLQQIVFNYLSNAIKFTGEAGHVTLACHLLDGDLLCVEVRDNGLGIRPEQQSRLFREFDQLDIGADLRQQGSGLGLSITRRLAHSLGGDVTVSSTPGVGSVFAALLPLARLRIEDREYADFAARAQLLDGEHYLADETHGDDTLCA